MGMSGSAFFQSPKKSCYALFALTVSPERASARASPKCAESHHSDRLYPLDIVAAKRYARSAQILVVAFSYTCKGFQFSPDAL
jgi:hypothetical protein